MNKEEKLKFTKKGQAAGAVGAIVTLVVGIGVAVLVLIFVGTIGGSTYNLTQSDIARIYGVVANEQFLAVNGTSATLANTGIQDGTLSIVDVNGTSVGLGNFTINYPEGQITLISGNTWAGTLNASYTHGNQAIQTNVENSIVSGFSSLETTADYLPIIVLAVVISLVLVLVLSFTSLGRIGGGSGSVL